MIAVLLGVFNVVGGRLGTAGEPSTGNGTCPLGKGPRAEIERTRSGMRSWERRIGVLEMLHGREQAVGRGWVLDQEVSTAFQQSVDTAVGEGLAELADRDTRAELSAHAGRPVRWAARLTGHGRNALVYAHARPLLDADPPEPAPDEKLVELRPAQMTVLRTFISLACELTPPPAEGLAERVRSAHFNPADNRWRLCLTEEQIGSAAYGFFLHRLGGSATEANRFAREYGVVYRPSSVEDGTASIAKEVTRRLAPVADDQREHVGWTPGAE